jgi:DNA-binding transcriptional ArsR family regulator
MGSVQQETQANDSTETIVEPLSTDSIFETLSNRRRRYVLHYLRQAGDSVTMRALSEQLAAWENGIEPPQVRPKARKRLYTALHQTHLPKMDQLGVVEYDKDRGIISLTDSMAQFDTYLDETEDFRAWSRVYLALGSVLTALGAVASLGIAPFPAVDGYVYAAVIGVLVTATAGLQTLQNRARGGAGTHSNSEDIVPPVETLEPDEQRRIKRLD